ncbi:ribonucleoside-diphosphate reductase subunit alpha [bacterium]|nr:ribonucleoside-diphosphate reductase subunit alpha [bacterium]
MTVIKRDGSRAPVSFDKVLERIRRAATGLHVDYTRLAQLVLAEIHDGVRTADLDELAARLAISYMSLHPDWGTLAARIIVSNCQRSAPSSFSAAMEALAAITDSRGAPSPALAPDVIAFIRTHAAALNTMVAPSRDFSLDYFGFKTLEKAYLLRSSPPERRPLETPQYMWLRVAVGIWGSSHDGSTIPTALRLERIRETYDLMSLKAMTHATPTLFNAGTPRPQLSSCFLMGVEDSLDGIFEALKQCAQISKYAGGIGIHIHNIRAQGSLIRGTNGQADGLVPMLRVFNNTARYVNQSGRRNGSFAIYLEPWHADIQSFLRLKTNTGSEEEKARDLFYALWIPDLFMRRVEAGGDWSLFCPHEAPGLADVHGDAFTALYERYEAEGRARRTVPAQKLWSEILVAQIETGTPYLLYKDAANAKSNQKNLGTIKSSNLCTEVVEYSSPEETAVCNLASIALPHFITAAPVGSHPDAPAPAFNFDALRATVAVAVRNLNRVIDINYYPTPQTRRSNFRHRPVGLGVQGLADVFATLGLAWESPEAATLNREIFEHIYYAALEQSSTEAAATGPYETYATSPTAAGQLQPDLWGLAPADYATATTLDWPALRARIATHGLRNSLLVAPMPTASTSQILGYNECIEPFTTNIYARRTLAGEFTVVNRHLVADLQAVGLWSPELKERIIAANGSVQGIAEIPPELRARYKTVWEIKQKTLIDMAADRGAFICQSQSLNLFVADPTIAKLSSMHFYAWRRGLKTGIYYLRTKSAVQAIKFTVDPALVRAAAGAGAGPAECLLCSS